MYLLALGLGLGCGWGCGSLSTPFLTSYVIGHELNVKNGLFSILVFSLGKIISMVILGLLVSMLSLNFITTNASILGLKLTTLFDVFMIYMGLVIIRRSVKALRGEKACNTCSTSSVNVIDEINHDLRVESEGVKKKDNIILFIAGFFYGLTPCVPLITILVICSGLSVINAFFLSLFFAIVTCISPTITNSLIGTIMNREMKRDLKGSIKYIQLLTGIFLVGFGILPIIK